MLHDSEVFMDGARKGSPIIDRTGQQWGQYRIISSVEQGRFSRAYLGQHLSTAKQFVIDILPMPLARDQADIFLRQARALTQLVHPHILRLVDAGVENSTPFVVLDYVSHIPLRQQYQKGIGQSLDKLLPYLKQVVAALQYAHDKEVSHKNLRPENVLLGWSSGVLLCDFAIDILSHNEQYQNYQRSRDAVDAMTYMGPEQAQRRTGAASDQYALGVMVYEWLCGLPPFQGSYFELANDHRNTPPPSLRQRSPAVSRDVESVVMTALAKDPAQRFGNITAFFKALEQAHSPNQAAPGRSVQPGPVVPAPPTGRIAAPIPSGPAPALASSGPGAPTAAPIPQGPLVVSAPATASISPPVYRRGPDPVAAAIVSPPPIAPVTPTPEPLAPRRGGTSTRRAFFIAAAGIALIGGGGGYLAWQRTHPANAQVNFGPTPPPPTTTFTPSNADAPKMVYNQHAARVNGVAWSPDGKSLASASDDKTVLVCDLSGKTLLKYSGHKDRVLSVAWSPDGSMIASASADTTVQVWDAATGKLIQTYTGHAAGVNTVDWSPDSRLIASGSDDRTVQTWFAATGTVFFFYGQHGEHTNTVSSVAWSPDGSKIASASWDKTVQVFATAPIKAKNILIGDRIVKYTGNGDEVYAVAWSPDGSILASGGAGNAVLFCNSLDGSDALIGTKKLQPRPHRAAVRSISWSSNGNFLVASDDNKEVREWDVRVTTPDRAVYSFQNHSEAVYATAWAPGAGSKLIASAGSDRTVQVWEAKNV
jgi:WD40 repeat protein/serine/threonine protein kinase